MLLTVDLYILISDSLSAPQVSRDRHLSKFMFFRHLYLRFFKCGIHDSFLSSIMPKNLVSGTTLSLVPFMNISRALNRPLVFVKCITTDFSRENLNPWVRDHLYSLLVVFWILLMHDDRLVDDTYIAKSSTYNVHLTDSGSWPRILFIASENKVQLCFHVVSYDFPRS